MKETDIRKSFLRKWTTVFAFLSVFLPLMARGQAPQIKVDPQSQTVPPHGRALLSVGAVGGGVLRYQWRHNDGVMSGETNVFLTLRVVETNQGGYSVVVSNISGSVTSVVATVTMAPNGYVSIFGSQKSFPIPGAKITALCGGSGHVMALRSDGTVVAWGDNYYRQCEVPDYEADVTAVAGGHRHSLVLRRNRTVDVWGMLSLQLNSEYYGQSALPGGFTNSSIRSIACGPDHNVIARINGTVEAWGISNSVPAGLNNVRQVAAGTAGYRNLARKLDGTVVAWGESTNVPVGLSNVTSIAVGDVHYLALKNDGKVVAWGSGSVTNVPVSASNVTAIAAGGAHSLALRDDGRVVGWGDITNVPAGVSNIVAITCGPVFNVAVRDDGVVFQWKVDSNEFLGLSDAIAIGSGRYHNAMVRSNGRVVMTMEYYFLSNPETNVPPGLSNVVQVSCGDSHTVALRSNGTVAAWGWIHGTNTPVGLSNVVSVVAGFSHSSALLRNGRVVTWDEPAITNYAAGLSNVIAIATSGSDLLALLNDGTMVCNTAIPTNVNNSNIIAVAACGGHYVALHKEGNVEFWGNFSFGEHYGQPEGMPPTDLTNAVAIACGFNNSLAIRSDGTVAAWGAGTESFWHFYDYGQSNPPLGLRDVMAICGSQQTRSMALYSVNPKPPVMTNFVYDLNNGAFVSVTCEPNRSYDIQISEDVLNWFSIGENYATGNSFGFNDSDALIYPVTYYRTMVQIYPIFAP